MIPRRKELKMSTYNKFFLIFVTLLYLLIAGNLWIQAPIAVAANHSFRKPEQGKGQFEDKDERSQRPSNVAAEDSTKQTTTAETIPKVVPGAVPNFKVKTEKTLSSSKAIRSSLFTKSLSEWIGRFQPNQGGVIWLSILVTILVAFDFKKLVSWRNADLLLLLGPSFLLIDVIRFSTGLDNPTKLTLSGIVFSGIFLVSVLLLIRALINGLTPSKIHWTPHLPTHVLWGLTVLLLACNTLLALVRSPDDCGYYTNMGTERMLKTGKFPYGDPALRGGAAATYGPVLYMAHVPFQLGISAIKSPVEPEEHSLNHESVSDDSPHHGDPPILATKLTLLFFHFMGVVGLVMIGRQVAGLTVGLGLACLYIGSAYVQGLGGETNFITGMTFISHIAPAAITILAFAALNRPLLAGALLGTAAGALFYPAFLFPLWLGYYFWRGKEWGKFAAGFLIVCAVILTAVLLMTQHSESESALQVIYESTVGHQEAKDAYGSSTFSFWGTHPKLAAFWQKPFIEDLYLLKPSFLIFAIFIGASFFMARGRKLTQFAFLTAAVAIAIQLWKSHAGGTYVEWYLPFFLIGLFGQKKPNEADTINENYIIPATDSSRLEAK